MLKNVIFFILIIIFSGFLTSCSKYQKLLKSTDNEVKYKKAIEYYEKEDYFRALQLFDQLIPVYRGTKESETIFYNYAYAYYKQEDYILASYYFHRFAKNFPRSKNAEECKFMSAYCKYLDSPVYTLDQTNTYEAIKELQLFINTYPNSERIAECNELIDKLRVKLEKKSYEIGKLYYKMSRYQAAVYSFNNLLKDFPDTKYREEALFYIIKSYYKYALKSIEHKKNERYQSAIESYTDFIILFPESDYLKEVSLMYNNSLKELNQLIN
ncbi:MAG: outer membrane protein assembly factor BamD [Bacteroidales bacterium]|nr:outer membrane protein assembly factor BamD [Bacteroidales bacterium]